VVQNYAGNQHAVVKKTGNVMIWYGFPSQIQIFADAVAKHCAVVVQSVSQITQIYADNAVKLRAVEPLWFN